MKKMRVLINKNGTNAREVLGSFLDCTVCPGGLGLECCLCCSANRAEGNEKGGLLLGLLL